MCNAPRRARTWIQRGRKLPEEALASENERTEPGKGCMRELGEEERLAVDLELLECWEGFSGGEHGQLGFVIDHVEVQGLYVVGDGVGETLEELDVERMFLVDANQFDRRQLWERGQLLAYKLKVIFAAAILMGPRTADIQRL